MITLKEFIKIDSEAKAIRKKIEPDAASPKYIQTHIGIGYRMLKVD